MDFASAIQIAGVVAKGIKILVDLGPDIIKTVDDAKPFATRLVNAIQGKKVTVNELASLEAHIDEMAAELQEPLPPE